MTGDNGNTHASTTGAVENVEPDEPVVKKVVKKKKLFVKACCGRCNQFIADWTVRTKDEKTTCPNRSGGERLLSKYLDQYEHSELYPSHIKCTYLGPEHVMTFPDLKAAKFLLTQAIELEMDKIKWPDPPALKPPSENGVVNNRDVYPGDNATPGGTGMANRQKGLNASHTSRLSKLRGAKKTPVPNLPVNPVKITCGLVCPKCQFLLASSPTCHHLDLNGQVVVYKTSLGLTTSETPFQNETPEEASEETPNPDIRCVTHHNALPLIHNRQEFEEILLKSAIAVSPKYVPRTDTSYDEDDSTIFDDDHHHHDHAEVTKENDNKLPQGQSNQAPICTCAENRKDKSFEPADLVIVMGGQFWNPFCVSGVPRLSDYKRRQEKLLCKIHRHQRQTTTNGLNNTTKTKRTPSTQTQMGQDISSNPTSKTQTPFPNISISSSATTDSGILPNVNLSKKKHNRALPMPMNVTSAEDSFVHMSSNTHVPCTFLLLDSLEGAGGVSPDKIFRKDIANTVNSLPKLPYFLVWYRGCMVKVEGTSQHIQCAQGAIVGLDIARYVDIVVPRIALGCQLAFAKVVGLKVHEHNFSQYHVHTSLPKSDPGGRSASGLEDHGNFSNMWADLKNSGSLGKNNHNPDEDNAKTETAERDLIAAELIRVWTTKESIPPLEKRPVLTIKL